MIRKKELTGKYLIKKNWFGWISIKVQANVEYEDSEFDGIKWVRATEEDLISLGLINVKEVLI